MERNIGKTDKTIRGALALLFALLGAVYSKWLYLIAAILLITLITGFCGLYKLLGISTRGKNG